MPTVKEFADRTVYLAGLCGTDRGDTAVIMALLSAGIAWKEIERQLDSVNAFLATLDALARAPKSPWTPAIEVIEEQIEIERERHGPTKGLERAAERLKIRRTNETLKSVMQDNRRNAA